MLMRPPAKLCWNVIACMFPPRTLAIVQYDVSVVGRAGGRQYPGSNVLQITTPANLFLASAVATGSTTVHANATAVPFGAFSKV